jgi:tetratricopeptide (TPR) repeat protein
MTCGAVRRGFLLSVVLLVATVAAQAADEEVVLRMRGERLAAAGQCAEALPILEQSLAIAPAPRTAYVAGQCLLHLQRYGEAVDRLEEAREGDAGLPDVDLYLGIARFSAGDLAGAEQSLAVAAEHDPARPELHLYRGLILLRRAEATEAAAAFHRAGSRESDEIAPAAAYFEGVAWAAAAERRQAEDALHRVGELAPDSEWAAAAAERLADLPANHEAEWWITLTVGVEYDDNVVLRGSGVPLPEEIADQEDWRGVWRLNAGRRWYPGDRWSLGAMASYAGNAHADLSEFNLHHPALSLWVDRQIGTAVTARLQGDVDYAWIDGEPYLTSRQLTPAVYYRWDNGWLSQLFVRLYQHDYLFRGSADVPDGPGTPGDPCLDPTDPICGPVGVNEAQERERDGEGITVGVEHTVRLPSLVTDVTGRYAWHLYDADGDEYSHHAHELRLTTTTGLPARLRLDTSIDYTRKSFRHPSTFPDPRDLEANRQYPLADSDREDDVWQLQVGVERPVSRRVSAALRYRYITNDSNVAVFDYNRQIVGAYVTVRYP